MELSKLNLRALFGYNGQNRFVNNIINRKAKVGIVGVGYVGKALAQALLSSGFQTYGYDINPERLQEVNHRKFIRADSINQLESCAVVCICVPTPLDEKRQPDLKALIRASNELAALKTKKQLVIVESTVAPGTLRNVVLPIFEKEGKIMGEDFYLSISPERVDPGNKVFTLKTTPKVVGGIDGESAKLATEFYSTFIDEVVTTTTSEVAELSKLLENTFRLVNISLINEIKVYADKAGIDIWEVINAAATKPFAFMPHYPGPGVGGHCIPVDPVYLIE
ncbi:nucleotide sugar dehydrogenase, partial [Patescibacteria group bacterium]|nr:nucleotide sugar dehydrogenase [Patescibacteria group bacterium]